MVLEEIFVTVGSTKFDAFIETVTSVKVLKILKDKGCKHLVLQIGTGSFVPQSNLIEGIVVEYYRFKKNLDEDIAKADLIISHAGAGSCLEALRAKKSVVVVVNENLMDNHQTELAEKLFKCEHLYYSSCKDLHDVLNKMDLSKLKPYPPGNADMYVRFIDKLMGFRH